ncbi:MAG: DUF58 domain-containing protein [Thermofilaceae archaeon]|nr:DUF58 domain-containing protein [Thermofilaceae archaeon]MCX8179917.1 DUF58 domain-containing protein [Thermofilaceae archaeon]MDW8004392.1 DUF58 domain-containing protein [Thermofilaceae archaeon]
MSSLQYLSQRPFKFTLKGLLYFALLAVLLITSVLLKSFRPVVLSVPIALTLGFSSVFFRSTRVNVVRAVERSKVMPGEVVRVELIVSSSESCPLEVRDTAGGEVVEGSNIILLNLTGERKLDYKVRLPRRGLYNFGPTLVVYSDPMNLWENVVELGGRSEVVVLPELLSARGLKLGARYTGVWPGEVPSRRSGKGYEFYGVREYVPGDELKRINWRVSARLSKLMSNEQVEEKVTDVLIVVDAGVLGVLNSWEVWDLVDAEASLAASLAYSLLRTGNRVGLVVRARDSMWLRPGFGKRQLDRILYLLAGLEPGEPAPLDYALSMLTPYLLKPNAEFIAITPLLDSNVVNSILDLSPRYSILVISPNPLHGKTGAGYRALEVERNSLIVKLSNICRVIDWVPGTLLLRATRRGGRVGGAWR